VKPAASRHPLAGVRVLVGRAHHQAGALSSELRKLGATVIEIPFIEIRKPKSFRPLDNALKNLNFYDWLVLTSVNGVEAMWERLEKPSIGRSWKSTPWKALSWKSGPSGPRKARKKSRALAPEGHLRVAAIGPATQKALEQRGVHVDVVPKQYIAESVVRSLRKKVKGKRVLLVRAKVARDVIPRELRKAGAHVEVVEAYETVVPRSSRDRLRTALSDARHRPNVVTFTSSSTVKNFVALLGPTKKLLATFAEVRMASIGPVTSSTLREQGLRVDIKACDFTIPGLVKAIVASFARE